MSDFEVIKNTLANDLSVDTDSVPMLKLRNDIMEVKCVYSGNYFEDKARGVNDIEKCMINIRMLKHSNAEIVAIGGNIFIDTLYEGYLRYITAEQAKGYILDLIEAINLASELKTELSKFFVVQQ